MQSSLLRSALAVFLACLAAAPAAAQPQGAELENTHWRLTELSGKPVGAAGGERGPYIELRAGENPGDRPSLRGHGGCNRLVGGYRLKGNAIQFGPIASTRMACASGMDQEHAMLEMLAGARMWKIRGRQLDLCDADGKLLARFEARERM
jgi:heat shock protein HslJ